MAITNITFSDELNNGLTREIVEREYTDTIFWSRFVDMDQPDRATVFKQPGQLTSPASPIMVKRDLAAAGNDFIEMSLLRELTGAGVMGGIQLTGNTEGQVRNFIDVPLNLYRHGVAGPTRVGNQIVRTAQLVDKHRPQLRSWIARRTEFGLTKAWYETYSDNLTAAQASGGYGTRFAARPHPNIFTADGDTAARATFSTTIATYNTTLSTAFTGVSGTDDMTLGLLIDFKRKVMELQIPGLAGVGSGDWWHPLVMSYGQFAQLKQDTAFQTSVQNAAPRDIMSNPMFSGAAAFVEGFVIFPVNKNVVFGATVDDPPVFGPTLANYMARTYDTNDVTGAICFGPSALCWAWAEGPFFTREDLDHNNITETGIGINAGARLVDWRDSLASPTTILCQNSALLFTNSP